MIGILTEFEGAILSRPFLHTACRRKCVVHGSRYSKQCDSLFASKDVLWFEWISLLQCAKILVEHGCDVNIEDKDFLVASDLAKKCGHFQAAKFLRSIEKRVSDEENNQKLLSEFIIR